MRYDISQHNLERVITLPDSEIAERYKDGETIAELAAAYKVSSPTLTKALVREGIKRRKAVKRPGVNCGSNNPAWNGGRRIRLDGYIVIWTPNGEMLEHRFIMEKHIGRSLSKDEIVHHKDENKQNNNLNNLEIMTRSEHASRHLYSMHAARYGW